MKGPLPLTNVECLTFASKTELIPSRGVVSARGTGKSIGFLNSNEVVILAGNMASGRVLPMICELLGAGRKGFDNDCRYICWVFGELSGVLGANICIFPV